MYLTNSHYTQFLTNFGCYTIPLRSRFVSWHAYTNLFLSLCTSRQHDLKNYMHISLCDDIVTQINLESHSFTTTSVVTLFLTCPLPSGPGRGASPREDSKNVPITQNILVCGKLCVFITRYGGFITWKYRNTPFKYKHTVFVSCSYHQVSEMCHLDVGSRVLIPHNGSLVGVSGFIFCLLLRRKWELKRGNTIRRYRNFLWGRSAE